MKAQSDIPDYAKNHSNYQRLLKKDSGIGIFYESFRPDRRRSLSSHFRLLMPLMLVCALFVPAVFGVLPPQASSREDIMPLVEAISKRMLEIYLRTDNWKAKVTTIKKNMDNHWQPKEIVTVRKIVESINDQTEERILSVAETKNGLTRDITEKYIRDVEKKKREEKKKEMEQRLQRKKQKKQEKGQDTRINGDDILPFSEKKRRKYQFSRLDDSIINGQPVFVIEARSIVDDKTLYDGKYFINQDTLDIVKVIAWPSKNPRFVKEAVMEIDLLFHPDGFYALKKTKLSVNGGILFIKRVRRVTEEEYSDYEFFETEEKTGFLN